MTAATVTIHGLPVNPMDFVGMAPFREGDERTVDARRRLLATSAPSSESSLPNPIEEIPVSDRPWKLHSPADNRPELVDDREETTEELQHNAMMPFLVFGLETFMELENALQMGMKKNHRAPGKRVARMNGKRARGMSSPFGKGKVKIPKRRNGKQYVPSCFQKYKRIVPEMARVVQQAWIGGVSMRTTDSLAGSLESCGVSKSEASRICMEIYGKVKKFLSRPLWRGRQGMQIPVSGRNLRQDTSRKARQETRRGRRHRNRPVRMARNPRPRRRASES